MGELNHTVELRVEVEREEYRCPWKREVSIVVMGVVWELCA